MFWIAFISLIALTLLWVLLAPVILRVDSQRGLYRLSLPGILSVRIIPSEEIFFVRVWAFFIPFRIRPFKTRRRRKKKSLPAKKKEGKRKRKGLGGMLKNMKSSPRLLRTVRIKRLHLDIDTDDFVLNAWLVPAFSMVNNSRIRMQVNFEGRASLDMDLRIRLANVLWTMIITTYKNKFQQ